MSNFFEIPCHSLVSSYGGIGSIIETPKGSLIVLPMEKWPYYIYEIEGKDREHLENLSVDDPRLLQRLNQDFPDLRYLLRIPSNSTTHGGRKVKQETHLLSAEYFPKWLYCPKCLRFMSHEDWYKRFLINRIGTNFELTCPECQKSGSGKRPTKVMLEQIRFIKVYENGDIDDFHWDDWFNQKHINSDLCERHEYYYKSSPYSDDLESIRITCKRCNKSVSLSGIFNDYGNNNYKTAMKSSNSVYFPAIIKSLLIPLPKHQGNTKQIEETHFRDQEFRYLKTIAYSDQDEEGRIDAKEIGALCTSISLISLRSLTMASVLCSYSRVEPISAGVAFKHGKSKHVTLKESETRILPCIESLGEGFLLVFSDDSLNEWYLKAKENDEFVNACAILENSYSQFSPFGTKKHDIKTICIFVLLHSISHILIKQLEYFSGYPAASMNERIYCSSTESAGIMIYTIAGSEGSYGGIVSLVEKGALKQVLLDAIQNAKHCTNDPVCISSGSVCFSCTFLPETSCECFNKLLNRSFIVDDQYGYHNYIK